MTHYRGSTKYFVYARKSSESEDRQVQSIDDQILRMRELAAQRGLTVAGVFTEARSAKSPHTRPVFDAMLKRIERGDASGILCWQINRLSRNPIDSGRIAWMLQSGAIMSLHTIEREFRPEDNVLLFSVETGMANQYILDLSRNVKRGMRGKIERGGYPFLAPLGYLNDRAERTVVKDPERFSILRMAWEAFLTGAYSVPEVLAKVNEEWGFLTRPRKRVGARPLGRSELYRIFSNPFYAGIVRVKGKEFTGSHDPMVTEEEFRQAQCLLGRSARRERSKHYTPYTGFIRCGECGCSVVVEVHQKKLKQSGELRRYAYYHCTWQRTDYWCSQRDYVPEAAVTAQLAKELGRYTIDSEAYKFAVAALKATRDDQDEERTRVQAQLQQSAEQVQRQLSNLTRMRYSEQIDENEFVQERASLHARLDSLARRKDDRETTSERLRERLADDLSALVDLRSRFLSGTVETKRVLLLRVGLNYTLRDGNVQFQAKRWLQPIERTLRGTPPQNSALEPPQNTRENEKRDESSSLCLIWSAILAEIWNAIMELADEEREEWYREPTFFEPRKAA